MEFTQNQVRTQNHRVLDIGCGNSPVEGAIGIDILPYDKVDVVGDACRLPFADESFTHVTASQLLEHLGGRIALPKLFEEIWRVLKTDGKFRFDVPFGNVWDADPTHETHWRFKTILYFLTRKEVVKFGYDPESFPDYYQEYDFSFTLSDWSAPAWLSVNLLPLRALSRGVEIISKIVTTDAWADIPFGSGNLVFHLQKQLLA